MPNNSRPAIPQGTPGRRFPPVALWSAALFAGVLAWSTHCGTGGMSVMPQTYEPPMVIETGSFAAETQGNAGIKPEAGATWYVWSA
jgi:hypothetical protein